MDKMTKTQIEDRKREIRIEIQKCDVEAQDVQCRIARHREKIAELESSIEQSKLRKASLYVEWEGLPADVAT